jgi:hypothetical protein
VNQWNSATRTHLDFVICDALSHAPIFAVEFDGSDRPIRKTSGSGG